MSTKQCYCKSDKLFSDCCEPFLNNTSIPETAESLMRSRYSAFCLQDATYIKNTMKGKALSYFDEDIILLSPIKWLDLKIIAKEKGQKHDEKGIIKFRALFQEDPDEKKISFLEETSVFKKIDNRWYYVDLIPNKKN